MPTLPVAFYGFITERLHPHRRYPRKQGVWWVDHTFGWRYGLLRHFSELLDTCLRVGPQAVRVLAWITDVPHHLLYLSAFTLAEIQSGIEKTREQDPTKASEIEAWLNKLEQTFNVLPMNSQCFRIWARLMHRESDTALEDAMIAATAIANKLTLVTRNTKEFNRFGVNQLNPFKQLD